jgi:hypothetical protein
MLKILILTTKDAVKGVKFNNALGETLAHNEHELDAHLEMLGHAKGVCVVYCKDNIGPEN